MGLDIRALAQSATAISKSPHITGTPAGDVNLPTFNLLLWPD
jgi:hypothetical protein